MSSIATSKALAGFAIHYDLKIYYSVYVVLNPLNKITIMIIMISVRIDTLGPTALCDVVILCKHNIESKDNLGLSALCVEYPSATTSDYTQ